METSPKGWQSTGSFEGDSYKQLQQGIQRLDYVPILDLHYKLLAKSEYDIDKNYSCVFSEIDTPTEKERAEIREINSRTDSNYINSGVIAPDEVRTILREDANSGYNALGEEIEQSEEDPFDDIIPDETNSTESNPFSLDEEPKKWITTETGTHIPLEKGESKKEACKEFFKDKKNKNSVEKSINYDKVKNRQRKPIHLPKEEYAQVMHELNTNLPSELKNKKTFVRSIGNYTYKILNLGFNNYKIIGKTKIDDIFN